MAKRVLVVEDTANIRHIICHVLRQQGYEVTEAADGNAGYDAAVSQKPDLLVLDAMLPHRSGFEICADLKEDAATRGIPILMLTAITQGTNKTDEYWRTKSGAEAFMSKPFRSPDLVACVQKLIGPAGGEGEAEKKTG